MAAPFTYFPQFRGLGVLDTEFQSLPGCRPKPVSFHYLDVRTGIETSGFLGDFGDTPPYATDGSTLVIGYYASAELGFTRALKWPDPDPLLCAYIEFRALTNGLKLEHGAGLIGAAAHYHIDYPADKGAMVALIHRGPPYSDEEERKIRYYCGVDVRTTWRVVQAMYPKIDIVRALYRGLHPPVAATMEWHGLPMDTANLFRMRRSWTAVQDRLITNLHNRYHGIYRDHSFIEAGFRSRLADWGIPWPRLESGHLCLDDKVFREISKVYPTIIGPLREVRHAMSQLRLEDLAVSPEDGRNRTLTSYYRARSTRSQPSNSKSIFGTSVWLRGLIKPGPGRGLAVCDYSQQEFGTVAALSGDKAMMRAYSTGDSYLGFAIEAGAVSASAVQRYLERRRAELPADDDDNRVYPVRELYKPVVLSITYGRGELSLARTLDLQPIQARVLIEKSHTAFPDYWAWNEAKVRYALLNRITHTVMGFPLHLPPDSVEDVKGQGGVVRPKVISPNARFLGNFQAQGNAAEMTRLAARLAYERGVQILLTMHDAIAAESSIAELADTRRQVEACMVEASRIILGGFELRVDSKLIAYPARYSDKRGVEMWGAVMRLLDQIEAAEGSQEAA